MEKIDISKILAEYDIADDFGFSAVSKTEYTKEVDSVNEVLEQTVCEYKQKLQNLEKLIIPFLGKLLQTADNDYIYWPKRAEPLKQQIEKVVKITRG